VISSEVGGRLEHDEASATGCPWSAACQSTMHVRSKPDVGSVFERAEGAVIPSLGVEPLLLAMPLPLAFSLVTCALPQLFIVESGRPHDQDGNGFDLVKAV
jgi:hypothetical protein